MDRGEERKKKGYKSCYKKGGHSRTKDDKQKTKEEKRNI